MQKHYWILLTFLTTICVFAKEPVPDIFSPMPAIDLPELGDSSRQILPAHKEKLLGAFFMQAVRKHTKTMHDPIVQSYVKSLGQRLIRHADFHDFPMYFFTIDQRSINAFAGPGGFIGVHSGLILESSSESELASVLAHEIAHVSQHHIARSIEQAQQLTLPGFAAMLAAAALAKSSPEAGNAALASLSAGMQQFMVNHTRQHEQEADRIGIQLLAKSGFDPNSMPKFFEKLLKQNYFHSRIVPEYLSTHPLTEARITDAKVRAEQLAQVHILPSLDYALIKERVRFYYGQPIGKRAQSSATRFTEALEASKKGNTQQRDALLAELPVHPIVQLTHAEFLLNDNNPQAAISLLNSLAVTEFDYARRVLLARAHLQRHTPEGAITALQPIIQDSPQDLDSYQLLSEAYTQQGDAISALRAQAEVLFMRGSINGTLQKLRDARVQARGATRLAVEDRIKEIEALVEEFGPNSVG